MAEPRFDVTSFSEMLWRLSVPSGERLETAKHLDIFPAGAEVNFLSLLARRARLRSLTAWARAMHSLQTLSTAGWMEILRLDYIMVLHSRRWHQSIWRYGDYK